ncbi:MAG: hypothetical protein P4L28_08715 [Paludibacteraceae bacterium]|nr:hypothetical protein [Paludibacteraceae bacterium]
MKPILKSCLMFLALTVGITQLQATTLLSENFGTPSGNPVITSYTGWSSSATFSGTGSVRISAPSNTTNYGTASGNGNIFLNAGQTFIVSGINTLNYTNLSLSLGFYQYSNTATADSVSFQVSTNGTTWTPLTCNIPSKTWALETVSGTIPATSTLYFKVTNNSKTCQFRVDDITLTGTGAAIPTIISTSTSEVFTTVAGTAKIDTITVSGTDLTENIALALSGTDANLFSISATAASYSAPTPIAISYNPTAAGSHTATLTLTSSKDTVKVILTGKAYKAPAQDTWVEDFEKGTKTGYAAATVTCTQGVWDFTNALIGNPYNGDKTFGSQAARIRDIDGYIAMNADKTGGADTVTVYTALYGSNTSAATWTLSISTNQGSTWTVVGSAVSTTNTALAPVSFAVKQTGNVRFKITKTNATNSNTLNIDNIAITSYTGAGINENTIGAANVYGAKGYAVVELTGKANVEILSVQGIVLTQKQLTAGKNSIALTHGIYIVKVGANSQKIMVY